MLNPLDLPPREPIYTFVANDGQNTHIAAARLRAWCLEHKPEIFLVPAERRISRNFIRDNVVSKQRCLQLAHRSSCGEDIFEPIIFCRYPGPDADVMLVDGHHRYVLAATFRHGFIKAHILSEPQWRPFEIDGTLISLTKDELRSIPITPRNY